MTTKIEIEAAEPTVVTRLVVKVGSSTVTQSNGVTDRTYIADLAAQIAAQRSQGRSVILVSSGAVAAGMARLGQVGRPKTIPQKQAAAAVGQGLLMQTYADAFGAHGVTVAQILLTRDDLRDRTRYLNARNTFAALLKAGVVPIVNENDTVAVDEIKFGDNDTLAALVASLAEADALLLLSDVAGLYDRDPTQFADAELIPVVEKIDKATEQRAGSARSKVGAGGMTTKIQAAKICAGAGVRMTIANGHRPNVIADALAGECGTLFLPRPERLGQRKRWIAYGIVPKGSITVNDGARQRLVDEGKSLLPAGVTHISGHFRAGELVRLLDAHGHAFAQGFVNYANDDLFKIMGRRTADISQLLGAKPSDEVVHRDNLVLNL
ncbi:glutamate 5-kinase [Capsulimonas corticalis]|nr:glutamate 5-kinase [Capsulimonas corticalis]